MGIINITKTHPDGTVETEEINTDDLGKSDGETESTGSKERKSTRKTSKTVSQD